MTLTDDDLRALIESAADAAPDVAPLTDAMFVTKARRAAPRRSRRWVLAPVVAIAAVAAVLFGVSRLADRGAVQRSNVTEAAGTAARTGARLTASGSGAAAGESLGGGAGGAGVAGSGGSPSTVAHVPAIADTARIIKNGSLELRVNKGAVTESVNRLTGLVTGFGGYIADTKTTSSSDSGAQGSATIAARVPAAAFEQLTIEASKLGDVRATTTSGQDITAQFTDIDAQLTALNATRDQLLSVLATAKNVGDILAVQDRLTAVQTQIDQLEGQKRLLTDQTGYGTLTVTFLEPGATTAVPGVNNDKDLGDAWRAARRHFVDGIEWVVEASGAVALVVLAAAAAWLVFRAARRRII